VSGSLRLIFFGNSQSVFSNQLFIPLLKAACELVGVVDVPPAKRQSTNPQTGNAVPCFVEAARVRGTPVFEPANPNTPDFEADLTSLDPDLFLAAGYMFLLKPPLLSIPHKIAVNFHASLLPAYRGKHPVFWALRNGEREAGLTAHVMDPCFDTGDILYQVRVPTLKQDTVKSLYERILASSVPLVPRLIADTAHGRLQRIPQPESGASYYSSPAEDDFHLDWTFPAESLRRWIHISPGECWSKVAGRRVFFMDAELVRYKGGAAAGELVRLGGGRATVAAGGNALVLQRVLPEGEADRPLSQLCSELDLQVGDRLEWEQANAPRNIS